MMAAPASAAGEVGRDPPRGVDKITGKLQRCVNATGQASAGALSFPARRAGRSILGRAILRRRCSRERLVLMLGAIVEANSQPQQGDLWWLTVDESGIEHRLTFDCDAQAGHPISQLRAAGGMQGRNLDEPDRRWIGEGGFYGAVDQLLIVRGCLAFFCLALLGNGSAPCAAQGAAGDDRTACKLP